MTLIEQINADFSLFLQSLRFFAPLRQIIFLSAKIR